MDEVEVALTLLSRLPPSRKVVNLDAGLMNRRVVEQVKEKGGTASARGRATSPR